MYTYTCSKGSRTNQARDWNNNSESYIQPEQQQWQKSGSNAVWKKLPRPSSQVYMLCLQSVCLGSGARGEIPRSLSTLREGLVGKETRGSSSLLVTNSFDDHSQSMKCTRCIHIGSLDLLLLPDLSVDLPLGSSVDMVLQYMITRSIITYDLS